MAVTLTVSNRFVRVDGLDLKTLRALDKQCSYRVAGYWFSPAYKSRRWDGKEHLFKFTRKRGYHAPAGMAEDIARILKKRNINYGVEFATGFHSEPQRFTWSGSVVLRGYQNEAVRALLGGVVPGRGVLKMPIRSGKALEESEPVLTVEGWKPIGSLTTDDWVYGSDGLPTKVTGVFPQGRKKLFKISFDDGTHSICCADHLWTFDVLGRGKEANGAQPWVKRRQTRPLKEWARRKKLRHLRLPTVAIRRCAKELPIEPYTLGVLLGNGHLKGTPTVTLNEADAPDIAARIEHVGTTLTRDSTDRPGCIAYRFSGKQGSRNRLSQALGELGLLGLLSGEKRIPKVYLNSSLEQRLALLAGLVDTDGSACRAGASYHTTSEGLAQDALALARSVGCRASLGYDKCWRVIMRHSTERLFRTKRKLAAQTRPVKRTTVDKYVKKIEPYGTGQAVCISVDAEDGLFVTRDYTLTHNTKTIARVLWAIGRSALFVVPSRWLLHQTIASLRECMPDAPIGQIGDGVYDVQHFTVATIQSLALMAPVRKTHKKAGRAAHPEYATLMSSFDVGVFDEAHHIRGDGDWYRVFVDLDARCKIGVSATIFFENTKEQESGIIWLRGTCGPIRYEVSASRLIHEGYLLPQRVKMFRVWKPEGVRDARYSATLKKKCITENTHRNRMIARIVRDYAPRKTIIIAREHAHIAGICEALDDVDVRFRVLTGQTSQDKRQDYVDDFVGKRGPHVLIGNVLGEGVDIPDVEIVVNAEGGKDEKQAWQRQRNLTVVEGSKKVPELVDFYDCMSSVFEKHSKARLKVYRSESEFSAEVLECSAED